MKVFLALMVALPSLLAFGSNAHTLGRADVTRLLLAQMNGSSAGRITRSVNCHSTTRRSASGARRYTCILEGKRATERVDVTVSGSSWSAEFAPLQG
jgi:hypothetical protein